MTFLMMSQNITDGYPEHYLRIGALDVQSNQMKWIRQYESIFSNALFSLQSKNGECAAGLYVGGYAWLPQSEEEAAGGVQRAALFHLEDGQKDTTLYTFESASRKSQNIQAISTIKLHEETGARWLYGACQAS